MNSKGNYEQFRDAIAFRESSGDPTIENKYGYIGLYQFGEAALQDLGYYKGDSTPKKNDWIGEWTGKNGIYSKDDFLNPKNSEKAKEIQNMVADEWFALLWKRIQRLGLDKYVGQTVDGIEITESGLIAASHLKGVGALKKFLEGKLKNTKDGFGTDIREYLSEFGGYDISPIKNKSFRSRESDYANKVRRNVQEGSRRIDPLVIDLDGDGIKLVNINQSNAMFDLTGSGFANKTGWISSGDAFLVWDRNNDNRINDISEMFGSGNQSGFKALALYDTNRDGRIDAFDDVFKNLKLWQDRNGDGRTDEGELLSLRDVGIKSINLNTTQTNINQEGNLITEVGSVEFEDGRETQAGNVNFELDRLYSYYNREVELNPEIVGLPWVRGYGFMPDLPIAMSLDNTLLQMVKDAVAETDLTKLKEKFEKIIFRWAGVENITDKEIGVSWAILSGNDREHRLLYFDGGITLSYEQVGALQKFVGMTPEEVSITQRSGQFFLEAWNTMFQGLFTRFVVDAGLLEDVLPAYYDFFTDKIIIDEDFDINAYKSQIKQMISSQDLNQINLAFISMMVLKETNLLEPQFIAKLYTDFSKNPEVLINGVLTSPYIDFLFNKVILGTTGNDWLYGINQNDIIWGNSGDDRIYGYDGDDILIGGPGNDYMDGGRGSDTYVFNKGDGQDIIYGDNLDTLKFGKSITKEDLEFSRNANDLVIRIKNSDDSVVFKNWFYSKDLKFGKIEFIDGSILSKEEIESMIDFYTIKGTDKDDVLYGTEEDDTIFGLGGNDRIYGGRGNDILIGGPGNDYLEGGSGSDIYIFNKGDGQDEIIEWLDEPNKTNIVKFGESITKDDISFKREGEDLIVEIKDSSDRIKIFGWFVGENSPKIDRFEFSDGSIITKDEINNLENIKFSQIKGTDGDDVIFGSYLDEEIYGYGGNDYIYGSHGNDFINAGDGDDFISVNNGNSVVIGDKGNDYICLYGQGEKIVEFNKGEGIDTIDLLIWGNSSLKIKFGEGISREDLSYLLKEEGIFIGLKNTEEGIFIKLWAKKGTIERVLGDVFLIKCDYYTAGWSEVYNLVEKISIEFKDGSVVSGSEILESFSIKGTDESDVLYGTEEPDILIGKKGNDYLNGGSGRDLYIFNPGDGQDVVQNRESQGIYNGDVLNFKTDKENIVFFRDNNDLIIGYSNNDFVKVLDQFKDENSGIERIEVKDGYYITRWDIENIVNAMIDFTNDKGMSYAEIYNNLLNNQNFNMLLSQSWSKSWVDSMGVT